MRAVQGRCAGEEELKRTDFIRPGAGNPRVKVCCIGSLDCAALRDRRLQRRTSRWNARSRPAGGVHLNGARGDLVIDGEALSA